eukprot:8850857-Pyramimonas_sp.AAC.1
MPAPDSRHSESPSEFLFREAPKQFSGNRVARARNIRDRGGSKGSSRGRRDNGDDDSFVVRMVARAP